MRLSLAAIPLLALTVSACDKPATQVAANQAEPAAATLAVTDAMVQLPAVAGRPGAAYFTIHGGKEPARLMSVSLDRAERVELHETMMEGNVMRMRPLSDNAVQPGATLAFEAGGRHAMLFGLDPALKAGAKVKLTFAFEPGGTIETEAEVRAFGEGDGAH